MQLVQQASYPLLVELVMKHLAIPTISASAECSFSSANLSASALRSCLTGKNLEMLNILHSNKNKFLNLKYCICVIVNFVE